MTSRGRASFTSWTSFTRPGRRVITTMRSASVIASERSWVTNTTVGWRACHSASSSACRLIVVWVSSAPNGSSMRRISGSTTSVRMSATRWRMPPDSVAGNASSNPPRPASAIASRTRRSRSGRGTPRYSSPTAMLRATVRHGNTVSFWKT